MSNDVQVLKLLIESARTYLDELDAGGYRGIDEASLDDIHNLMAGYINHVAASFKIKPVIRPEDLEDRE